MTYVVKSVPVAAKYLLDYLSGPESRGDYNVWSSFKQENLPKPLTKSTINEVLGYQRRWRSIGGISSAAGRYQIIRKTLEGLVKQLGLSGNELFDEAMQDYLGYTLLKGRGYASWAVGELSDNAFGNNLAKEWASLPVLSNIKNYKGKWISPGTSYYAGDGLNSHGVSADSFRAAILAAKDRPSATATVPVPKPKPIENKTVATCVAAGGAVVGGAATVAVENTSSLPDVDTVLNTVETVRPLVTLVAQNWGFAGIAGLVAVVAVFAAVQYFRK